MKVGDNFLGSPSGLLDGLSPHFEEQVAQVGHSACPVDESCYLVVEALDLARGDAVFEKGGDGRQVAKQAACEAA